MARVTRTFKYTALSEQYYTFSRSQYLTDVGLPRTGTIHNWIQQLAIKANTDLKNVTFSNHRFGQRLNSIHYAYHDIPVGAMAHKQEYVSHGEVIDDINYRYRLDYYLTLTSVSGNITCYISKSSPPADQSVAACVSLDIYVDITGDVGGELQTKHNGIIKKTKSVVARHSGVFKDAKSIYTKHNGVIKETK